MFAIALVYDIELQIIVFLNFDVTGFCIVHQSLTLQHSACAISIFLIMDFNGYTEFLGKHQLNFLSRQLYLYSFLGYNLIAKFFNTLVQEQNYTALVISPVEQLPSVLA